MQLHFMCEAGNESYIFAIKLLCVMILSYWKHIILVWYNVDFGMTKLAYIAIFAIGHGK